MRNAIYTALIRLREDPNYIGFYGQYVPDYWEDCELINPVIYFTENNPCC